MPQADLPIPQNQRFQPRVAYVAYPTSLTLRSANAIQTYHTFRELVRLSPDSRAIIPRWGREPSRFADLPGVYHLPRPALGKLSRLHKSSLWYYGERSLFAAMSAATVAAAHSRGWRPDVVYVRELICALWWSCLWGPLLGLPVIYEAHELELRNPSRAKERWAQPLLQAIDRLALSRATAVASLTGEFRRELAWLGWRNSGVAVIPDAYDEHLYQPLAQAPARASLGLPPTALLVVYAGATFAYRGLDRLVRAFASLAERHDSALLYLVGGRPQEVATLREQARVLGIGERVRTSGALPQAQVPSYLAAADILAIPDTVSDVTASPLKLFEYMAMERAIVCVDLPALREVLPADAACWVRRGSAEDLARGLCELADDPLRRAELARRAVAAAPEWTYGRRAARVLDLAQQVLGRA
jgi:glycosyltransferase involved in cell wall biosynthesis